MTKQIHNRATRRILSKLGRQWGEWDEIDISEDHPDKLEGVQRAWSNDRYAVQYLKRNGFEVLMVRRHDGGSDYPWRDLQRIKDEVMGPDREAVQVFPKKSEIVDSANMAHIWLIHEDSRLPYTFKNLGWSEDDKT